MFLAGLTYYGAQEFSGRAADTRASTEAMSFAEHSSLLATGDAFDGYIQILRYADDPILNAKSSTANERADAMQRLLYVNINKFTSLTLVDRAGLIFASTDSTISNVRPSTAFTESRANLAPANTDVILPEAGHHGYVEYSAPLRDPDGTIWGILLGRADPATLWKGTLAATVDGSRNVIINSEGLYAAGVPDELLRQPWHGRPLDNGGVRATIAGVDSICGLAPIGKDTQIDRGLNVASCLPASLIQVERHAATGKQAWITIAAAVLAIVIAAAVFKLLLPGGTTAARVATEAEPALDEADTPASRLIGVFPTNDEAIADPEIEPEIEPEEFVPETTAAELDHEDEPAETESPEPLVAAEPIAPPPPPDVDALMLIEAFEQRNARLAERLRETVQARLLVATTEADAAFKLVEADAETAATMHEHAMNEIEHVRVQELRTIGQEMYPGLTRLGLAGALRAMRKTIGDDIKIKLDLDATTDSVGGGASRASVSPALRLVMYRFALETVRGLAAAQVDACDVSLHRDNNRMTLIVSCGDERQPDDLVSSDVLAPSILAVDAYAGRLTATQSDGIVTFALDVPAPEVEPGPEITLDDEDVFDDEPDALAVFEDSEDPVSDAADESIEDDTDDDLTPIVPAAASGVTLEPRTGLAASMEALQAEFFGSMIVTLDLGADIEAGATGTPGAAIDVVENVAREALRALQAAESRQCDLSVRRSGPQVMLTILAEIGDAHFDATHINAWATALEGLGGYLSVNEQDGSVAVSAEIEYAAPADAHDDAANTTDTNAAHAA